MDSNSSDYTVKNNGGGEWSIQLANPGQTSIRISLIIIIVALILTRSRMGNSAFFIALIVPIIDSRTGKVVKFEALARFYHESDAYSTQEMIRSEEHTSELQSR